MAPISLPRMRLSAAAGRLSMRLPSNRMRPPAMWPGGSSRPMMAAPVSDLPAPDSPTTPSTSPSPMAKEMPSTAIDAQARIDGVVKKIDDEIDDDKEEGDQHKIGRHHRDVGKTDRLDDEEADARPLEHRLGDDGEGDDGAELQTGDGDDRHQGVLQRMAEIDGAVGEAAGARELDVVGAQDLEHLGAHQAHDDDFGDRPGVLVGEAEIAMHGAPDEARELDEERIVETERLAQLVTILLRRVLSNHVVDRVADEVEQRKGDEGDRQHDGDRLQQATNDEGDHGRHLGRLVAVRSPLSPLGRGQGEGESDTGEMWRVSGIASGNAPSPSPLRGSPPSPRWGEGATTSP